MHVALYIREGGNATRMRAKHVRTADNGMFFPVLSANQHRMYLSFTAAFATRYYSGSRPFWTRRFQHFSTSPFTPHALIKFTHTAPQRPRIATR